MAEAEARTIESLISFVTLAINASIIMYILELLRTIPAPVALGVTEVSISEVLPEAQSQIATAVSNAISTSIQRDDRGAVYTILKVDQVGIAKDSTLQALVSKVSTLQQDSEGAVYIVLKADQAGLAKDSTLQALMSKIPTLQQDSSGAVYVIRKSGAPLVNAIYNADATVDQSVVLDTGDYKVVSIVASATASTTFKVEYSFDGSTWFTYYQSASPETSYSDVIITAARYVRLSSAAVSTAGAKVTLVLAAKP